MKKILLIITIIFTLSAFGQQNEIDRISISAVLPDYKDIPVEVLQSLESKLQSIVAQQGMGDRQLDRFLITARIDVTNKDITQTAPPKISMKIDITFIIGDVLENIIYGTHTISSAGIGINETKAYIAAFQRIKSNNPELQQWIAHTKRQIIEYYEENCSLLVRDAESKALMGQYDEAIMQLITVPSVCSKCYASCRAKSLEIYDMRKKAELEKLDKAGRELIRQARSTWSLKHDYECAEKALDLLSKVDPDATCVSEADELVKEINDYLRKVEAQQRKEEAQRAAAAAARAKQQWEFKMRQYEDNLADRRQAQSDRAAILGTLAERFGKIDINIKKERTFGWAKRK